jgi:ERCC4-type nuclease
MIIKIDIREQDLIEKCRKVIETVPKCGDIQLITESLPLGDVIINDGASDCIIIERKSLSDLAASIKDGRYEEQSYRLNGISHHNHNIVYLIEGDLNVMNSFKSRIDKQTLYSAMFSINYFKGFSVMRSMSKDESALIVCNMAYKLVNGLKNGKKSYYDNNSNVSEQIIKETIDEEACVSSIPAEKNYCSVVKKVKKENITPENIGEIMLCQIPSISSSSAIAIMQKYKTIEALIKAINEDPLWNNDIFTTDSNGKNRKIGSNIVSNLNLFFKHT